MRIGFYYVKIKSMVEEKVQLQLPIIILSIAIVTSMVYFGFVSYGQQAVQKDEIRQTLLAHEQEIRKLRNEIDLLRFETEGRSEELKKKLEQEELLRQQIQDQRTAQERLAQQKLSDLEARLSQTGNSGSKAIVIGEWQSRVAYVDCDFVLPNSLFHYGTSGSGIVTKLNDVPVKILTNKHVLTAPALYTLNACSVTLPDTDTVYHVLSSQIEVSTSDYDWGILNINNPDQYLLDLTSKSFPFCEQKPSLGDEIIVLGYPGIGSKSSVTATEGIISGFDGSYFITSAKVEEGNSGGAAILLKDNCLLGIPTFATLGQVESLARILDIWTVITK